ncbi:MAG: GntR family transcriptional regulator [Clostridia bacterium]|jgi:DNA-binding GntR family transcriptional regulator
MAANNIINDTDANLNSLQGRVFTQIQNDILNGKYEPGDSLIETRLCEEMGVSRTPIREAIRQLELEGLVQSIPNKGAIVNGISTKDIDDIYKIRIVLEGIAARWATEKITDDEISELKNAVELQEFYTQKNDIEQLMKYDSRFHDLIYEASKSKPLMHTLSTFHHYVQRARNLSFGTPGRALNVLKEHEAILKAISDRNPDEAEKLTTEHVKNASINLIMQNPEKRKQL